MFEDIYREFLVDDDPELTYDDWRRLFAGDAETGSHGLGYALVDGSTLGGILGMLFSRRCIQGQVKHFCNLHTWMVKPEFRGHSLLLMRPALRLSDHTVTDFTPTEPVRRISRRLGFQPLNADLRVLFPFGGQPSKHPQLEFLADQAQLPARLTAEETQLLRDHCAPDLTSLLVSDGRRQCYLIYTRVTRWQVAYCHIHYLSDPQTFAAFHLPIRKYILQTERVRFLVLNDRQVSNWKLPNSCRFPLTNGHLVRTTMTAPEQIDSLYSDLALLRLTTIKGIKQAVKERFFAERL